MEVRDRAPRTGDLVVARYDEDRGFFVTGLVLRCRGIECFVQWSRYSLPNGCSGWWRRTKLRVVGEAK